MIVITGATGHIGNILVEKLSQKEKRIRAFVLPGEDTSYIEKYGVEIIRGDIRSYSDVKKALLGAKYVFHLAGMISIETFPNKKLYDVNVNGTRNVIQACLELSIKRLVYVSSIHAFLEPKDGQPITEAKTFYPSRLKGYYAKSKALATMEVFQAVRKKGLNAVIVHPTGVIGPNDYKLSHIAELVIQCEQNKIPMYVNGGYNFVDVRDVADGIISACYKGKSGENYILSGGYISVAEMLSVIQKEAGISVPRRKAPMWAAKFSSYFMELHGKVRRIVPLYTPYSLHTLTSNSRTSHEKATKELGYHPRSVQESLRDLVQWLQRNQYITIGKKRAPQH